MGCRLRIFSLVIGSMAYYLSHIDLTVPEEFYFKTDDFITKYGYGCETHYTETEDGFNLTIFRILPRQGKARTNRVPVVFEAGLFGSSDVMVLRGPDKDLPFILADEGFDVWLGNYRGNRYSIPGPKSNLYSQQITNFGFEEIGIFDFAAKIDYVLNCTNNTQVDLAVVSAGSSSLIALQSLRPEYNGKIRKALHLGSGMALVLNKPYQKFWFYLCWKAPSLVKFTKLLEPFSFKPQLMLAFCERTFLAPVCKSLVTQSIGYPEDSDNPTLTALLFALLPSGNPLGVVDHIMQLTTTDNGFKMRDWGPEENLRRYNSTTPPLYDVSKINTFTRSYNTKDEGLVTYELPRRVFSQMRNYQGEFMIESPFAHVNFFINGARNHKFIADIIQTLAS